MTALFGFMVGIGALTHIWYTPDVPTLDIVVACETVLDGVSKDYSIRYQSCLDIGLRAPAYGIPTDIAVAVGWIESRHHPEARSKAGAVGPLQVLPRYWCANGVEQGCDLVGAGLRALVRMKERFGRDYLCHYNGGNRCWRRSKMYARAVQSMAGEIRNAVKRACDKKYAMCCGEAMYYERYSE